MQNDTELLTSIQNGDKQALAILYDFYSPILLALVLRIIGNQAEAEDVIHDLFLDVWCHAYLYDGKRASVRTWLIVKARSKAIDCLRQSRIKKRENIFPETLQSSQKNEDIESLRAALACLSPQQQQLVDLIYFQGLTTFEAAETMHLPVGTVKSRLITLRSDLKNKLQKDVRMLS